MTDCEERRCALPSCGQLVGTTEGQKYCSVEHRLEARRLRAERNAEPAHTSSLARSGRSLGSAAEPSARAPVYGLEPSAALVSREAPLASELTESRIVRRSPAAAAWGWRGLAYRWSGRRIHVTPSSAERQYRACVEQIRRDLVGPHHVAIVSLKGGVGKTTIAAGLGLTLAEHRGDRVVAIDATPNPGTLAERLVGSAEIPNTISQLVARADTIDSFAATLDYTSLAGRLEVVASDQDPNISTVLDRDGYASASELLGRYFDVVLTDSGTGMIHSAMRATLTVADSLVVVGTPTVDGASRAAKTLDWLTAHGHGGLVSRAILVLSCDRTSRDVDGRSLRRHFDARCRSVHDLPYDPHLATGGRIELDALTGSSRRVLMEVAADVADDFA
ncbi:MinD/ParA family ATP-binding protein [Pseudonocardia alni]|uniref:MinD/ParA family ATP-binding protein n=1 Tax=Pseudonocardia alni TaxID=33907 RepID=UPI00280ABBC8|nr:MinD/ParA family protein [Pseudonocardia alni]